VRVVVEKIGGMAGKVWEYLHREGEVSYATLRRNLVIEDHPMPDVILAGAIGWLAREGKIRLCESGRGRGYRIRVSLVVQA
jgi:hypothetical protein